MPSSSRLLAGLMVVSLAQGVWAQVAARACTVAPFRGATSRQGAVALVQMKNTGATCQIANFGVPDKNANPASSGAILAAPRNGKAVFKAPEVHYTPRAGFVGEDEFEYEAHALGRANQPMRLLVKVRVSVEAAQ